MIRSGMRRLSIFVLSVGVVVAVVSAGVALGSGHGSSPISQAAGKSAKATSVKFDFTLAVSAPGASVPGGKLSLNGTGALDSKAKAAEFSLDLGSLAPLVAASAKGAAIPKSIDLVVINNAVYVHLAALAKQLGAPGKQWVKLDLSKLPKSTTAGVNTKAVGSVSPQQALAGLQSALSVHKVGSDHYGTHYQGTLNLAGLLSVLPISQRALCQHWPRQGRDQDGSLRRLGRRAGLPSAAHLLAQSQDDEGSCDDDRVHAQPPRLRRARHSQSATCQPNRRRLQTPGRPHGTAPQGLSLSRQRTEEAVQPGPPACSGRASPAKPDGPRWTDARISGCCFLKAVAPVCRPRFRRGCRAGRGSRSRRWQPGR